MADTVPSDTVPSDTVPSDTVPSNTVPSNGTATTIDRYLAAYGEADGTRRRQLIAQAFTVDATLADPPLAASGHDGIDEMSAAVQGQFPDHSFRRVSAVDEHHGAARYEWELVATDGTISVTGTDFVRFADDGRIAAVVGFFGPIPQVDQ